VRVPKNMTTASFLLRTIIALSLSALIAPDLRSSTLLPNPPTISPFPGTYSNPVTIYMTASSSFATIRYTPNGMDPQDPSGTGLLYTAPFTVSSTTTIKARAYYGAPIGTSLVASATYTILETAATPTFSPASGSYSAPLSVSLSTATRGAVIRYTTNGTDPTQNSIAYSGPFSVPSTRTIRARAYISGMNPSAVGSATYTIVAAPTPTPTPTPAPTPTPTPVANFIEWSSQEGLTGDDASPNADPDRDRLDNLVEYYLGLEPTVTDTNGIVLSNSLAANPPTMSLIYKRSTNTIGVTGSVVWATALTDGNWSTDGIVETVQEAGDYQEATATVTNSPGEMSKFLRLQVQQQ
jgi:hypothetical protein